MKTIFFSRFSLLLVLFCVLTLSATAQRKSSIMVDSLGRSKTAVTSISATDQRAIREIFRGVPTSKYRLQFNGGKTVYGSRNVSMSEVKQIKRVTNPAGSAGYIVFVVEGKDVIYVLAVGSSELTSVIGREKAQQLNKIMAKYQ